MSLIFEGAASIVITSRPGSVGSIVCSILYSEDDSFTLF